jgi:RND family efflux transporter MFP subunit
MKIKHCSALMLVASIIGMALAYGYAKSRTADARPQTVAPSSAPALITTARPRMRSLAQKVPWIGEVESRSSVELTAPIAGRVTLMAAKDQDRIEMGRLVMRLGGPQIEGERAKDVAEIQSLESRLRMARQIVERLERSLKTQLATRDQVAQARETQIDLETQLRNTRLSLKALDGQVRIPAPISGIFTNRRVSPGQEVAAGQVIGDIIDTGRLRIAASIFPPPGITLEGKKAAIELDATQVLTGSVRRVLPQVANSGAVRIWIQGPQIDSQLRPGQTVEGTLVVKAVSDTLTVPQSAIVYDTQEHPYLFVRKDGAYAAQGIRLGLMQAGWVQVLAGLAQDQAVVVQGAYELYHRHFNDQFKVED